MTVSHYFTFNVSGNQDSIKEFAFKTLEDCMQRKKEILADTVGGQFRVDVPSETDFYIYQVSVVALYSKHKKNKMPNCSLTFLVIVVIN